MLGISSKRGRAGTFLYPVAPVPRTAVLVPWFKEAMLFAGPVKVFRKGWSEEVRRFAPGAVAGTSEQMRRLADQEAPALSHAVILLSRPGERRLSDADRDALWKAFRVPIFEQIIGESGERLAFECEAHDGLHVESAALPLAHEIVDESPCPCGRKTPRIGVSSGERAERQIAAYAR